VGVTAPDAYGRARNAGAAHAERMVRGLIAEAPDVGDGHYASRYARAQWLADAFAAAAAVANGEHRDAWAAAGAAWAEARDGSAAAEPGA
jgi:hypothetical protein